MKEAKAEEIAKRITESRESLDLSQSELSRAIGATRGACSHWESRGAHRMTLENAINLSSQLGVTLDYLCHGREGSNALNKECLAKAVELTERLVPKSDCEKKTKLLAIAYTLYADGEEFSDSLVMKLANLA